MKWSSAQGIIDFILARQLISNAFVEEIGSDLSRFESAEAFVNELASRGYLSPYQQSQLLAEQEDKLFFGQYRLVTPLGVGGMGEVFKAWQPRLDRYVALKFIHQEYLKSESNALGRFQREAHAIGHLQHPNIIVLYDADEVDGVPFIALEFVDGLSLSEMVSRNGPLGIRQASEYIRQTALGLQHAYECGFVHRDIKPSNIVVCESAKKSNPRLAKKSILITRNELKRASDNSVNWDLDRVKILDMGLARLSRSLSNGQGLDETLTESGSVLGTPDYLAPEQALNPSNVDIRADLYSLGCTFYYILTGQTVFPGGTAVEKVLKHQCDAAPCIKSLRRDVPDTIARIVATLLAKSPDSRFQTPLDLAQDLSRFLNNSGGEPELSAPLKSLSRSSFSTVIAPNSTPPRRLVPAEIPIAQPADDSLVIELPDETSRASKTMVSAESFRFSEADFKDIVWATNVGSKHSNEKNGRIRPTVKLEGHNGAVSGLAVSRNGRLAVTADVNGQIRVWDLNRSTPREIDRRYRRSEIQAIAFAPHDLNYLVFGEVRGGKTSLVCWDWKLDTLVEWSDLTVLNQKNIGCLSFSGDGGVLAAGVGPVAVTWKVGVGAVTHRKFHKGLERPIRTIAVSPDRTLLAAAAHDNSLRFWHLAGGSWKTAGFEVQSPIANVTTMRFSPDGSILAIAGLDSRVVLWPIAHDSEEPVRELHGHQSNVQQLQFIGNGRELASIGMDGQIIFWDVETGSKDRECQIDLGLAYKLEMSSDGGRVVAGFTNGMVGVYSPMAPKLQPAMTG